MATLNHLRGQSAEQDDKRIQGRLRNLRRQALRRRWYPDTVNADEAYARECEMDRLEQEARR
jgi:hypothetical protein